MTKDLETITQMIMSLRPYPDIFRKACHILGRKSSVVDMYGLPLSDQGGGNNFRINFRKDAAWLHKQIDFEVDIGNHTTKGFYSYLTEQGKLWKILD